MAYTLISIMCAVDACAMRCTFIYTAQINMIHILVVFLTNLMNSYLFNRCGYTRIVYLCIVNTQYTQQHHIVFYNKSQ